MWEAYLVLCYEADVLICIQITHTAIQLDNDTILMSMLLVVWYLNLLYNKNTM